MSDKEYTEIIKILTETKTCVSNLEKTVRDNMVSQDKDAERYFKIIIALIATVGGVIGVKLNFPQATAIHVAMMSYGIGIDWAVTIFNFSRFYTIFALIFCGGSIIREYWKNGYNKWLGVGFVLMGGLWLAQAFNLSIFTDSVNIPFRLAYATCFVYYGLSLGLDHPEKE
jgi:hypothetical protein